MGYIINPFPLELWITWANILDGFISQWDCFCFPSFSPSPCLYCYPRYQNYNTPAGNRLISLKLSAAKAGASPVGRQSSKQPPLFVAYLRTIEQIKSKACHFAFFWCVCVRTRQTPTFSACVPRHNGHSVRRRRRRVRVGESV